MGTLFIITKQTNNTKYILCKFRLIIHKEDNYVCLYSLAQYEFRYEASVKTFDKKLRVFWKLGVLWETCSLGVNFKLMSSIVFNVSAVKFLLKNRFHDLWFVRVQVLTKFQVSFKLQYCTKDLYHGKRFIAIF